MTSWPIATLSSAAKVGSGSAFPLRCQGGKGGEFPFYKVSDMNLEGNEKFMSRANNYINAGVRLELRATAFPPGTIIFPKIGAAIGTNKKRLLKVTACVDNNVMAVTPEPTRLDPEFLFYLFQRKNLSDFA